MDIFYDYIFCKPVNDGSMTANGAYRGIQAERPTILEVIKRGKDVKLVKTGDIVLIDKYSGLETEIDGEEYIIITEKNLIAKIGENNGK